MIVFKTISPNAVLDGDVFWFLSFLHMVSWRCHARRTRLARLQSGHVCCAVREIHPKKKCTDMVLPRRHNHTEPPTNRMCMSNTPHTKYLRLILLVSPTVQMPWSRKEAVQAQLSHSGIKFRFKELETARAALEESALDDMVRRPTGIGSQVDISKAASELSMAQEVQTQNLP